MRVGTRMRTKRREDRDALGGAPGLRFRKRHGFTLVELLVVLSIIAALMALLLPALGKARRQARTLIGMRNMREIATGVGLYASDNDERYPPSIATVGVEDNWNWQAPSMLTGYFKRTPRMHRSVSGYLKSYIDDADVLFCPNAPMRYRYLQQAWAAGDTWDHPDTLAVPDAVFGAYCLYWNYEGYLGEEQGLFRGPTGPARRRRESSILVTDYFGFDHWRSPLAYGSCEPIKHAGITDGTAVSSAFWSRPGSGTRDERRRFTVRLHAGYVEGHVESYAPAETYPMHVIKRPETGEPYEPGVGPGAFYLPQTGLR